MSYRIQQIGVGKPHIGIVACMHGDERYGLQVLKKLSTVKLTKGSLSFIVAHPKAVKAKKRYFHCDLNRAFPGKPNGNIEERIAYELAPIIKQFDFVIDLHATNSNFKSVAIVTNMKQATQRLLTLIPQPKVMCVKNGVFKGNTLLHHAKLGVAFEYGPRKDNKPVTRATNHIKILLRNLDMTIGKKKKYLTKEIYSVYNVLKVAKNFKQDKAIDDFKLVKKGCPLGKQNNQTIISTVDFYSLFVGKGKYPGYFGMMATKKKLRMR